MPTSVAPTTVAPTTVTPTTNAPTSIAPTTAIPTTLAPTTFLTLAPTTAYVVNPALSQEYWVNPIEFEIEITGELLDHWINTEPIEFEIEIRGSVVEGNLIDVDPLEIELEVRGIIYQDANKCNWVKWSKVGYLDFTIDQMQEAGERPLDWKGCIYAILKLLGKVVAYGENGVTVLTPVDVKYGMQTIHKLGLYSRYSVAGIDNEHWFVDVTGKLYSVSSEGIKLLDYSEYLSQMSNIVLSLDTELGLLYICDGTYGFVFNTRNQSFGEGPVNVTGIGAQGGVLYVAAPEEIETIKFDIKTDIYDLGSRKPKTIQTIEFGTELTDKLQAKVDYRISNKAGFRESGWALVNPSGIAYIPCYGVEFRFRLRSYIYEVIELDYIKVNGILHEYSYLDSLNSGRSRWW